MLPLAEEPMLAPVAGGRITLDGAVDGLTPGRRVIVAGERADLPGDPGVKVTEVAMIAGIEQTADPLRPGDALRTTITLAAPLAYAYRRATAAIYGNVARATHGETRQEILGSGDASQEFQRFTLRQMPLTYISAPNPSGAESTLQLYVDDVRWHETDSLSGSTPAAREFITTDSSGQATIFTGDGRQGARLTTGQENVRAVYRTGIGQPGNLSAGQISQLASRPLGVKSVSNPAPSSGGADADPSSRMRKHIPLSLASLERLISVSDYAAFSRVFAGVGKASSARIARQAVRTQVSIAGDNDIPIDLGDDLFRNLKAALHLYGDPIVALSLRRRERIVPIVKARVKVLDDYLWERVGPAVEQAVFDSFGFEQREFGQTLFAGEVLAVIQSVPGVDYVELDNFAGISESDAADTTKLAAFLDAIATSSSGAVSAPIAAGLDRLENGVLLPAQLIYFDSGLPKTLALKSRRLNRQHLRGNPA